MMGVIFATDMSRHVTDLQKYKKVTENIEQHLVEDRLGT